MLICLEQGADLHMAQRISLPLTVCCFSKIQIGFTFLVPAHPGSPGQRAVKRVCVNVCAWRQSQLAKSTGIDMEQNYVTVTLCINTFFRIKYTDATVYQTAKMLIAV